MAKTISFGAFQPVGLGRVMVLSQKEFPGVGPDMIELHTGSNAVEMCVYEKHEPLTPIEGPTPGFVGGQFVWGKKCRVSLHEIFEVVQKYFPDEDGTGGVVLFADQCGRLVMEPYLD